ncbi:3-hydroxybutyryl-CoA dehydrogenase [Plasmodiophora brassicae]
MVSPAVRNLAVIGAGQMGTGIALVATHCAKLAVSLIDANEGALERSKAFCKSWVSGQVAKQRFTQEVGDESLKRIAFGPDIEAVAEADFVIEAVTENFDVKSAILQKCDDVAREHTILASNTSSISISKLGGVTNRSDRVIGMHFMNPVPVMKLVELIGGVATSEATMRTTQDLAAAMQKETTQSKDVPGFIANRLLMPYINEAVFVLSEGIATREDIDKTMKLGTNVPMGPLQLADFIGLDTCLYIMQVLHHNLGDSKYRPCPLLANMVAAGWLGKKSGKGFYDY